MILVAGTSTVQDSNVKIIYLTGYLFSAFPLAACLDKEVSKEGTHI
jgi:hypothetical protein